MNRDDMYLNRLPPEMRPEFGRALNERRRRAESKRRSRWGAGLEGHRISGYRIVVTEQARRGTAKRHVFVLSEDEEPEWERCTGEFTADTTIFRAGENDSPPNRMVMTFSEPLPQRLDLAPGVRVSRQTLTIILDALASRGKHKIDISDINRIVSQLGSRLADLDALDSGRRILAEPALYTEILKRCITI